MAVALKSDRDVWRAGITVEYESSVDPVLEHGDGFVAWHASVTGLVPADAANIALVAQQPTHALKAEVLRAVPAVAVVVVVEVVIRHVEGSAAQAKASLEFENAISRELRNTTPVVGDT